MNKLKQGWTVNYKLVFFHEGPVEGDTYMANRIEPIAGTSVRPYALASGSV